MRVLDCIIQLITPGGQAPNFKKFYYNEPS
jgi:hypothetical protein